jgi:DNA-binding LacI/PurR family transcriptional regulator
MRCQSFSADSVTRWQNIVAVAKEVGLPIDPYLTVQLERDISPPELGYPVVQTLLQRRKRFRAIVAFKDMSAIGAIRALQDTNLEVPDDVSVIGFDDIQLAAYHTPGQTTIRQPLRDMGETVARILLQRLQGFRDYPMEFAVPPELIIRGTTAAVNPKRRL